MLGITQLVPLGVPITISYRLREEKRGLVSGSGGIRIGKTRLVRRCCWDSIWHSFSFQLRQRGHLYRHLVLPCRWADLCLGTLVPRIERCVLRPTRARYSGTGSGPFAALIHDTRKFHDLDKQLVCEEPPGSREMTCREKEAPWDTYLLLKSNSKVMRSYAHCRAIQLVYDIARQGHDLVHASSLGRNSKGGDMHL
jgi:hypothetical protein